MDVCPRDAGARPHALAIPGWAVKGIVNDPPPEACRMRSCLFVVASAAFVFFPLAHARAGGLRTQVSGSSTGAGTLSRTIIDISEPPGSRLGSASFSVTVPIPPGASAVAVASVLIDSINAQIGPSGFTATFASPADSTLVLMSRASPFSSCDGGTIPGISVTSGDLLVLFQHLGHLCGLAAPVHEPAVPPAVGRVVPLRAQRGAGVPNLANCTIDLVLVACPASDLPFRATLRDINYNPVPGGSLILDFSQCTPLSVCGGFLPTIDWLLADGLGEAVITIEERSSCAGQVFIRTDAGILGTRTFASLDQDSDGDVDMADASILMTKWGTGDPTGDLDGDGGVSGSCEVTGVFDDRGARPSGFTLRGLWPSIVQPGEMATLELVNPLGASVVLELFDVVGRRILVEALGTMEPGTHRLQWRVPDGTRSGLYSLRVRTSAGERAARSLIVR